MRARPLWRDRDAGTGPAGSRTWLVTKRPHLLAGIQGYSGAQGDKRRRFRATASGTGELPDFRKSEQIGYDRLAAPVLVRTVGMQAVATASRFQISHWGRQIVAAQKPGKCPRGIGLPFVIA